MSNVCSHVHHDIRSYWNFVLKKNNNSCTWKCGKEIWWILPTWVRDLISMESGLLISNPTNNGAQSMILTFLLQLLWYWQLELGSGSTIKSCPISTSNRHWCISTSNRHLCISTSNKHCPISTSSWQTRVSLACCYLQSRGSSGISGLQVHRTPKTAPFGQVEPPISHTLPPYCRSNRFLRWRMQDFLSRIFTAFFHKLYLAQLRIFLQRLSLGGQLLLACSRRAAAGRTMRKRPVPGFCSSNNAHAACRSVPDFDRTTE